MKITKVSANNRKKVFEVRMGRRQYDFPYAQTQPTPASDNRIVDVHVDDEMGREGFVYTLESSAEGAVHGDHVLEYNSDPSYAADQLLYKLTLWAQEATKSSGLSTREVIRRLGTSPSQYYRLLDQTNHRKSMRQLLALLHLLNWDVDVVLKDASPASSEGGASRGQMVAAK